METTEDYQISKIWRKIAAVWAEVYDSPSPRLEFPMNLVNSMMTTMIAEHSNIVVQILDVKRSTSLYISENVEEFTGYTAEEVNSWGGFAWLRDLNYQETELHLKSVLALSKLLPENREQRHLSSYLVNAGFKTKSNEEKRFIYSNCNIRLNGTDPSDFHLMLWKDGTHLFKTKQRYVRHIIGLKDPKIFSYHPDKGKILAQDLISEREAAIIKLLKKGYESKSIAEQLAISPLTVDNHRKNILNRLQLNNTHNLLELAKCINLI
ncbi:MAG TPA: helix-turn-helix transcriptional regulator [Pelobium sp.]|nr:helix-turn-helix transcriptional regulator [Pelobium sp.]